ncbi:MULTISPECIES: type 2 periplasmic-binding domain-containing protein [Paraburkholderia]|uniref:hypothetical protein n=1 Tax=Paraburkholderia TaxID=1822464 RepID=UPI0022552FEF|nr:MULTISPECIES: hypothetical protein [Paraburkholderia]MCX4157584.1 hypothetical protein [Paraburkholderia aspalathi]MDN7166988.1 hypothetical protein [Paraburkholderia sp. SECH2]MDQ6395474.1 hypothetical protein [Paraburkholderia aspalathi]
MSWGFPFSPCTTRASFDLPVNARLRICTARRRSVAFPTSVMTRCNSRSNAAGTSLSLSAPAANYNIKKFPDKYQAVFYYNLSSYGIGFGVDDNGKRLARAFQQALIKLQKQAFFKSVMQKWGLPAKDGRPTFPVNDPQM